METKNSLDPSKVFLFKVTKRCPDPHRCHDLKSEGICAPRRNLNSERPRGEITLFLMVVRESCSAARTLCKAKDTRRTITFSSDVHALAVLLSGQAEVCGITLAFLRSMKRNPITAAKSIVVAPKTYSMVVL